MGCKPLEGQHMTMTNLGHTFFSETVMVVPILSNKRLYSCHSWDESTYQTKRVSLLGTKPLLLYMLKPGRQKRCFFPGLRPVFHAWLRLSTATFWATSTRNAFGPWFSPWCWQGVHRDAHTPGSFVTVCYESNGPFRWLAMIFHELGTYTRN